MWIGEFVAVRAAIHLRVCSTQEDGSGMGFMSTALRSGMHALWLLA